MRRIVVAVFVCALCASCAKPPIVIGFMGGLTGRLSDLGVAGRNGAELALELRNATRGSGRSYVFLAADDQQDAAAAAAAFAELRAKGAVAVIGPMTSDMALAVKPLADAARIPLVSPTASSPKLSGMDDYFLRVNPVDVSEGRDVAAAIKSAGAARALVILDLSNRTFSEGTAAVIERELAGSGVTLAKLEFDSKTSVDAPSLAARAVEAASGGRDAIVLVAASVDAAALAQALRAAEFQGLLFGTGWSMTDDYIRLAGSAAEGTIFSHYFDRNSEDAEWKAFSSAYAARFGTQPDFIAGLAANAMTVVLDALDRERDPRRIKERIMSIGSFKGLQGRIVFDPYGECELERFRLTVRGGKLIAER